MMAAFVFSANNLFATSDFAIFEYKSFVLRRL